MNTRRYEQRRRAETAEETRRRILDAVYRRLEEAPAEPVSMDRIARMAGVARSTIYVIFGSRAALFDALAADLWERAGYARLVEAKHRPDAREHLREALASGAEIYATFRDVSRALFSMALLDEEAVGGAIRRLEERRARGIANLARRLGEQGLLRPDVTVEEAADVLWVIASFDGFDLLYTGRGLPLEEVVRLLIATAERSLLRPASAGGRSEAR